MTHLIRAILFRISYRRYARFGANRMLAGKEIRPVVYRPRRKKR